MQLFNFQSYTQYLNYEVSPGKFTLREFFKTSERFIFIYNFFANKIK